MPFDPSGSGSSEWIKWAGFGKFWSQAVRWAPTAATRLGSPHRTDHSAWCSFFLLLRQDPDLRSGEQAVIIIVTGSLRGETGIHLTWLPLTVPEAKPPTPPASNHSVVGGKRRDMLSELSTDYWMPMERSGLVNKFQNPLLSCYSHNKPPAAGKGNTSTCHPRSEFGKPQLPMEPYHNGEDCGECGNLSNLDAKVEGSQC